MEVVAILFGLIQPPCQGNAVKKGFSGVVFAFCYYIYRCFCEIDTLPTSIARQGQRLQPMHLRSSMTTMKRKTSNTKRNHRFFETPKKQEAQKPVRVGSRRVGQQHRPTLHLLGAFVFRKKFTFAKEIGQEDIRRALMDTGEKPATLCLPP